MPPLPVRPVSAHLLFIPAAHSDFLQWQRKSSTNRRRYARQPGPPDPRSMDLQIRRIATHLLRGATQACPFPATFHNNFNPDCSTR